MVAPLTILLLVAAVGCSSSSGSNAANGAGPQGSGTPNAVCSSLASLKSSIRSIDQMKVNRSDIDQVKAKVSALGTAVEKFVHSAQSQYSKEVDAIQHDYASLKSAVDTAVHNPSYPTIAQVKTEFTTLANGVTHFASSVASGC